MVTESTEQEYYIVEFQSNFDSALWLVAANEKHETKLTREQACTVADRCESLGLGYRVKLYRIVSSVQLVMERKPSEQNSSAS